jgi:hypothetical protein
MNVSRDRDLDRLAAGIRAAWCGRPEQLIQLSRVRQASDMYRAELAPGVLGPRVLSDPDRRVQNALSMVLGTPVRILSAGRERNGSSAGLLFPAPGDVPHEHWLFVPGTCPLCHGPRPGIPLRPGDHLYAKVPAGGAPASPEDDSGGTVTWSDGHSARLKLPDGREVIIPAVPGGGEVTIPGAPGPLSHDSPGIPETTAPARGSNAGTTPPATARGQLVRTRARRVTRQLLVDGLAAVQPAPAQAEIPAGWNALAGETAGFEAEDEDHLLGWMGGETSGMLSYGEAVAVLHEHCVDGIRLDPRAITALHDVADAVADAAEAMARAIERFREAYEAPRGFVGSGRELPKDGDFLTGGQR